MRDASELNASRISLPASRLDHRHPIAHRHDSRTHSDAVVTARSALQELQRLLQHPALDDFPQRPTAERSARFRDLEHLEPRELLTVRRQQHDAALKVLERDPTLGLDDDVLAGAAERDVLPEAVAHQRIMGCEAERHAVYAVLVLGARMRAVVHVHEPRSVRPLSQGAVRSECQAVHREQRRGVVHARRLLAGLERGALDLQADDSADVAHNGIYQNVVSCGSLFPMRVTLGWARCADNVADILRRGAWYPIVEEADGHVVVEVRQQRVRLPRGDVTIRTEVPDHWSIVARTGVLRPTLGGRGSDVVTTYAVCPLCHYRQDFAGKPGSLKCVRCGASSPVDWTETC